MTTDAPARAPRLLDATVWREAALVWAIQRALVIFFTWVGARAVDPRLSAGDIVAAWTRWDGGIYTGIAQDGYIYPWQAAFYPLLPGLERALTLVGLSPWDAGMLIANLAALVAFGLLRALVERELGQAAARRTLLYLALFPTAFYLVAPYSEALFLALSVGCFIALRSRRWALAGLLAALAALTRPVGVLLIAPALVELLADWRARGGRRPGWRDVARGLVCVAPPALAVAGYYLVIGPVMGLANPLQAEASGAFKRSLAPPWAGFQRAGAALLATSDPYQIAHILLDGAFTALFIALTLGLTLALWRRRIPLAYLAYAWAMLGLTLIEPSHSWYALASNMRFMLVVFPLFMGLGLWGKRWWVNALILGLALPLLALLTVVFTIDGWVA